MESNKSIFKEKYLLGLLEEGWCLIDWGGQNILTRKEYLVQFHAIFSSNSNTKDWLLRKKLRSQGFHKGVWFNKRIYT